MTLIKPPIVLFLLFFLVSWISLFGTYFSATWVTCDVVGDLQLMRCKRRGRIEIIRWKCWNRSFWNTVDCNRNKPLTLETGQPEKPTPSGFKAKDYKAWLGLNVLKPLNPKFQVNWWTTSWDIHHLIWQQPFYFCFDHRWKYLLTLMAGALF